MQWLVVETMDCDGRPSNRIKYDRNGYGRPLDINAAHLALSSWVDAISNCGDGKCQAHFEVREHNASH